MHRHSRDLLQVEFRRRFGSQPAVWVRAPGRVNLIGEHTDYNGGHVLPFAIEQSTLLAATPRDDCLIRAYTRTLNQQVQFAVGDAERASSDRWQNYLRGVVQGLQQLGVAVNGADLLISGELPIGAGLSSSAALCVGTAKALLSLANRDLETSQIARLAQQAERDYGGTPCGIMDPYTSLLGRADHALLLDCRLQTHRYVPVLLNTCRLFVLDSGVQHDLSTGHYAARVRECQTAVRTLSARHRQVSLLSDVTEEMLMAAERSLDPPLLRRVRHVISENARVLQAARALASGEMRIVGGLLNASHESLRDDFEVSCPEIEALRDRVLCGPGVLGVRMVGGGFGGSLLILVQSRSVAALSDHLVGASPGLSVSTLTRVRPSSGAATSR